MEGRGEVDITDPGHMTKMAARAIKIKFLTTLLLCNLLNDLKNGM